MLARDTIGHPFFSADRGTWIAAALLQPGERVQTLTGTSTVDRVTWREGLHTVYNLEVNGPHTYFVGKSGAWVHNAASCHLTDELISNFARQREAGRKIDGMTARAYRRGDTMYLGGSHFNIHAQLPWIDFSKGWSRGGAVWDDLRQIWRWAPEP